MLNRNEPTIRRAGFTLVELLVVIGIIALLISILMPSLTKAKRQSEMIACQSNMRQVGMALLMYANDNRGYMFPENRGSNLPAPDRWPCFVFKPAVPNPKEMICPSDPDIGTEDLSSVGGDWQLAKLNKHSYILNRHLTYENVRYSRIPKNTFATEIVVMGEKKAEWYDYYMELNWNTPDPVRGSPPLSDYDRLVELNRHGLRLGSNLLYLDGHVSNDRPLIKTGCLDSWQIVALNLSSQPSTADKQ